MAVKKVVVPVDFSTTSAAALKLGFSLAQRMGLDLQVVHVSDLVLSGSHSLTTPEQRKDQAVLEKRMARFINKYVDLGDEENSSPKVLALVMSGVAASKIKDISQQVSTGLIVMGGVGVGAGVKLPGIYGSVASTVMMKSDCPVLLLPKENHATHFDRVAIAFGEANEVLPISQKTQTLIEALCPELRYVHVSKENWPAEIETEQDFIDLTEAPDFSDYPYKFDVLPAGDIVTRLTEYTTDTEIDLLVLGNKKQGFWHRLFGAHHLKPIIKACNVPMLVVPFSIQ